MTKTLLQRKKRRQFNNNVNDPIPPNTWQMRQLSRNSGAITTSGHRMNIGMPKFSSKLYPGQTMRINTGWNIDALPDNSVLTTVPNSNLLGAGILAIPTTTHSDQSGSELVQVIQNSSPFPIQFVGPRQQGQETKIMRVMTDQLGQQYHQQMLGEWWNDLLSGVVTVAQTGAMIAKMIM